MIGAATVSVSTWTPRRLATAGAVATTFLVLYAPALVLLAIDWWSSGEYGHGFLLLPIAIFLAIRSRLPEWAGNPGAGVVALAVSSAVFLLGVLAGEAFTQRIGLLGTVVSLTVHYGGFRQVRAWWLPFALLLSTIPLPEVLLDTLTLPLQLFASQTAVWLLEARHIPASQAGNVIFLPGQELFVAAACSGLRSLSALIGLSLLIAGTWLSSATGRLSLVALAIPAAIAANVMRVFLTGFAAYYIGPQVTHGLPHHALAAVVFIVPLGAVGIIAVLIRRFET